MSLQVKALSFAYQHNSILKNISFTVMPGQLLGLLGPNGVGKSTLLKCVAHLLPLQQGEITLFDTNIFILSIKERAKLISLVPQGAQHPFPISVVDTIMMGRMPYLNFKVTADDKNKVFEVLQLFDLEEFALKKMNELSGGERQQVLIARSIAQEPRLLLLDEPTSNLDLRNQIDVLQKISDIVKKKKLTAIMAIHDINLAVMFCDIIVLLKDQSIYAEGQSKEIITQENLWKVYGVETTIVEKQNRNHILLNKNTNMQK